jgi:predicted oxidoreductase
VFGIKPNKNEMESMIQICLENKINFDHADIYGSYTTENDFEKHLLLANSQRKTAIDI